MSHLAEKLDTIADLVADLPPGTEARRMAAVHRRLLRDPNRLTPDVGPRLDAHAALLRDPDAALRSAWCEWQDLRGNAASLRERVTAFDRVTLARRAVCR